MFTPNACGWPSRDTFVAFLRRRAPLGLRRASASMCQTHFRRAHPHHLAPAPYPVYTKRTSILTRPTRQVTQPPTPPLLRAPLGAPPPPRRPHSNRICRSVERSKLDRCDAFAGARGQAPRGPPGGTTKQQRPPGLVDTNRTTTTPHHRYCTPSWSQARSFSILQRQSSKVYMCRNLNPRTNRSRMSRPIRSRRKRTIITPTILCRTVSDADTSRIVESIYLLIYLDKKVWRPLKLNDRVQVLLAVVKPLVDVLLINIHTCLFIEVLTLLNCHEPASH